MALTGRSSSSGSWDPVRSRVLAAACVLGFAAAPARAQSPVDSAAVAFADTTQAVAAADSTAAPAVAATAEPKPQPNARLEIRSRSVKLVGKPENVLRTGPGPEYAIAGVLPPGRELTVITKTGEWYGVRLSDAQTAWVHASLCKEMDDLGSLVYKPNPKMFKRTGTFVLGAQGGGYSFDRKSNSVVLGGGIDYYVFDRVRAGVGVSWTHVHRPAEIVESLFGLSLEAEDFPMLFYQMNLTYELLPGRQMVPFVSGGVGSSLMLGRSEPSLNFGAGTTLFLSRRTAVRWEVRDYRFHSGFDSGRLQNDNFQFSIGTEYLY